MSLRIPIRTKGLRAPVSSLVSLSAPVKGWNARDPIAAMKPDEAISLENWYPAASDVMLRKGMTDHVTGIGEQVESLMAYNTPSGTQTLFAAADDSIYNVSIAGAVGAAVVGSLTNARWQHLNFTNSSGTSYLCCFNGEDAPQYWNGSAWTAITGISTPAITGLTTTGIISAALHKRRIWLVQKNSLKAWYLPVDAVGGAAAAIDLSGIAKLGGYIMAIESWTLDAGEGVDDYWVAITSEGEAIVYAGTDPVSADTWKIKGVWSVGAPIGRRCLRKFGGDLLMILVNGVYPLSKALLSAQVDPRAALTNKIEQAMNTAAGSYSGNFGWQIIHYPAADMVLLNVPVAEGSKQQQYAMNAITGAWCKFTGWDGNCIEVFDNELYMGRNGVVSKIWSGYDDNGQNIVGISKTAFHYFSSRNKKAFKMAKPYISSNGTPSVQVGLDMDYSDSGQFAAITFTPSSESKWGVAKWGVGTWATGLQTLRNWIGVSGLGLCAATRLKVASQGLDIRWQATDYLFEPGNGVV